MECPVCRAPVPEGSRFCPSCGHALTARGEERRVVTVLFADIVGFTGLSEGVDPEQVKLLVDRGFQRLVADIAAHGGRVDKIVGDAIVALFGAPVAHEDDAERAVRCALQMQRTLAAYAEEISVPVRMRVGVNTGEVLVGALRAGGDYTAMGDTVNVASRLQAEAAPGQIVVGSETFALTSDVVRYEPLGEVAVRGRGEPVACHLAMEALVPPGHRPRRVRTPLVGRDRELEILSATVAMAFEHRTPQVVLITGEAGIGKSRLVEEITETAAREHGAFVLEGRCVPYGEANVWWPIAAAVRHALDIDMADPADVAHTKTRAKVAWGLRLAEDHPDVVRASDGLLYLLGMPTPLSQVDPMRARDGAERAFLGLLENMAARRPIVLAISELHWADGVVLELLDRLPAGLRNLPIVILATARDELEPKWTPRPGRHNLIVLHLDPLTRDAAGRLLATLLESEPPTDLAEAVLDRSGGNPFYLEELAALLVQSGAERELPATLRSLVATRLDALPDSERRLLDHAAVIGRLGTVDALDAMCDEDAAALRSLIGRLVERDLLSFDGREWAFRSELVREVAYETLTKAERARHHAALGDFLAHRARAIHREHEQVEALAHHYAVAAELVAELGPLEGVPAAVFDRALEWIDRAAEQAEQREMPAVTARLSDQALRLLGEAPSPVRRRFQVRRARARAALRHNDEARADVTQVRKEADATGDAWAQAAALTVQGQIEQAEGALLESAATLDEAIERWRALGDRAGEADALRQRGFTDLMIGRLPSAEASIAAALALYRDLDDRRGQAWAQQNMAWIAFNRGETAEADERLADSVRLFEEAGDWGGLAWAYGLMAWVRLQQGDLDEADRIAESLVETSDVEADRWARGMMLLLLANTRLWRGRTDDAVRLATEARDEFEALGDTTGVLRAVATLARVLVTAGDVPGARDLIHVAREMAAHEIVPEASEQSALVASAVAVALGEAAKAFDLGALLEGVSRFDGHPDRMIPAALALLQFGRAEQAIGILERVYPEAPSAGARKAAGAALALALAVGHRPKDAIAVADEVLASPGGTYLDVIQARTARALAAAQLGEVDGARIDLAEAVAIADGTDDRLSQAIMRLAQVRVLEHAGDERADDALVEVRQRLSAIGLVETDWDGVFQAALAGTR